MIGKRHDLTDGDGVLEQGEYGKTQSGIWFARVPAPGFGMGSLSAHDVTEHADGTITVSPSILCTGHFDKQWHGWLIKGVWTEA